MKAGDLVKHIDDGDIGLVVECDDYFYSYKVTWIRWSTTGWYTPDRLVVIKKDFCQPSGKQLPQLSLAEHTTFMCVERHPQGNRRAAGSSPAGSIHQVLFSSFWALPIYYNYYFQNWEQHLSPIEIINLEGYDFPEEPQKIPTPIRFLLDREKIEF